MFVEWIKQVSFIFCFLPSISLAAHTCILSTINSLDFGLYNPMSASPDNGTGSIRVRCQGSGKLKFEISMSTGNSGNYANRYMLNTSDGTTRLYYNIYTNNGRTEIWGDGTGGTKIQKKNKKNNFTYNKNVFGRIPAGQTTATVGHYLDTLIVTLDF